MDSKYEKGYEKMLQKVSGGKSVSSYHADGADEYREDGYVNMLNKYGTSQDVTEHYHFVPEFPVPDVVLAANYETNGLFAKIIDAPAEEAVKHGFTLEGITDAEIEDLATEALDELDWEEVATTCIKWARLFGGSMAVMLIDDGRGLEEPLDWRNIKSIEDIRVFDRSRIQPDYGSIYHYDPHEPRRARGSRLGMPEWYQVFSRSGNFVVHDSRCLTFQNGILPEITTNSIYRVWGVPEYLRINKAIRDAEVAHGSAPKLLDRSVQPIYKMRDLSAELATEEGEDRVIKRLQAIDMAKGLMNTIAIDSEGEEYDFRTFQFSGVSSVIESSCNFLSAVTSIPQTILFGRSPAGMNATGHADFENWYNYVERIQKRMLRKNLRYLLNIIFKAGIAQKKLDKMPTVNIKFNPLWSLTEEEEIAIEQQKAQAQLARAQVATAYVQMQALDPGEVRKSLAKSDDFDVETMLDDYSEEELEELAPKGEGEGDPLAAMMGGGDPAAMMGGGNPAEMMGGDAPEKPKAVRTGESGIKVELQELEQAREIDLAQEELRLAHEIDKDMESEELVPEENTDEVESEENPYETTWWKSRVMDVANHTGADYEDSESMLVAIEDFLESPERIVAVQAGVGEDEGGEVYNGDYDILRAEGELLERYIAMSHKWHGGNLFRVINVEPDEAEELLNGMEAGRKFAFDVTTLWTVRGALNDEDFEKTLDSGEVPVVFVWKSAKSGASVTYLAPSSAEKVIASRDLVLTARKAYEVDGVVFVECKEAEE